MTSDAERPHTWDYRRLCFADFVELHGDRQGADDPCVVGGLASLEGVGTVMVVAYQQKRGAQENIQARVEIPRPEGFRKALRLMRHAEKFHLPLIMLIDAPGADPTQPVEEHGQAYAMAETILALSNLRVPIVAMIVGEGSSGDTLTRAMADRVLPEPASGAHANPPIVAQALTTALQDALRALLAIPADELLSQRAARSRAAGAYT